MSEKRFFPSADDYESDRETAEIRQKALEAMGKLRDIMNSVYEGEPIIKASKIAELEEIAEEISMFGATRHSLDPYLKTNGQFTEKGRQNPNIMAKWVAHDVRNIILSVGTMISSTGARRMLGELSSTDVGDDTTLFLSGDLVPARLAEFLGKQVVLAYFYDVLDAKLDANIDD